MINHNKFYIKETLKLAKKGLSWTNPNPMTGAIIVKNGQIIGQGFHHQAGKPHAEIEALNNLTESPKGAILYVNLEPCSSFGKTPPCVDKIIESGIKRVIFSTLDPNPKNYGAGLKKLKEARIETVVGILEEEAKKLNETFFTFHTKNRPFIALKFAASLDGKLATCTNSSKWITNGKARKYARLIRAQYQGILVGINTILLDNPSLGAYQTRSGRFNKDPLRIILDPKLEIPLDAEVLRDNNVIIVTTSRADTVKAGTLKNKGFTILSFDSDSIQIPKLLSKLKEKNIISILVEGGGETLGNFLDSKLIDKVYAFHAPLLIGGKNAVNIAGTGVRNIKQAIKLKNISYKKFDGNILTIGYA